MTKILFICHGNICRSPMAKFIMEDLVSRSGLEGKIEVDSAATSREELGNPVYRPARTVLKSHGIAYSPHAARQMTWRDYDKNDLIICMDKYNVRNALDIVGKDPDGKIRLLLDFAGRPGEEVADPWYTGDYEEAWDDILQGCEGLLAELKSELSNKQG